MPLLPDRTSTTAPASAPDPAPDRVPDRVPDHAPDPSSKPDPAFFTAPTRIKVLQLPEEFRVRADSIAQALSLSFQLGPGNAALERVTQVCQESCMRRKPGDHLHWEKLVVEKRQQRQQRQTAPANALGGRMRAMRPTPRLAISAPALPKTRDTLDALIGVSPSGNAWSGHHYWKPEFSQSVPASPSAEEEQKFVHSDPTRRAVYEAILVNVAVCVRELRGESQHRGNPITEAEAEVVAAMTMLEGKNQNYDAQLRFPLPKDILAWAKEFEDAEVKILEEYTVQDEAELNDAKRWLQVKNEGREVSTVLDHTQAGLRMIWERKKNVETDMLSTIYGLVYAVQVLEEKLRKLKEKENAEDSGDEEMEYGKFLKSVKDEMGILDEGCPLQGRQSSVGGTEIRRLKGKAPSALDLESWATELKALDPRQRKVDLDGGFF